VKRLIHMPAMRVAVVLFFLGLAAFLLWWRGPDWGSVGDAFAAVRWEWVVAAIGLNLLSVLVRAFAWRTVIAQALPPPHPTFPTVFSAFSVGLFANAVLPGRVGELARVAVLTRRFPGRQGVWATLVGSVFAHRVFDLFPSLLLVVWVLATAKIPSWAITSLTALAVIGIGLFVVGIVMARRHPGEHTVLEAGLGPVKRVLTMARYGLAVMRSPVPAAIALLFQCLGWVCQLFAVWTAMRAFHIYKPLPAAGLVLVLMNIATILPLWPGNVGLLQAAIALPLRQQYAVATARGFAFGFGLQLIEASVGVGVGLIFLAREGLSFAMLRVMPEATKAEVPEEAQAGSPTSPEPQRERARVPG
jgi:glycosyltransferase 2 family protein